MPKCDVCLTDEAALTGCFCARCARVLLDDEARRFVLLMKAGKEDHLSHEKGDSSLIKGEK